MQRIKRSLSIQFIFTLWLIGIILGLTSCQQPVEFDKVYTVVAPATIQAGEAIPLPTGDPMLTVTGKIRANNRMGQIEMDRETVERVGVVEYTVNDPFAGETIRYTGVLMRDLLALWQVAEDAQTLSLVALNDYVIEIPISEFRTYPILFAMQADGVYMEPEFQGPAMLVYPLDAYTFDVARVKRNWIWQIKSIEIK